MHDLDHEVLTAVNDVSNAADEMTADQVTRVLNALEKLGFDVRGEYDLGADDDDDDDNILPPDDDDDDEDTYGEYDDDDDDEPFPP